VVYSINPNVFQLYLCILEEPLLNHYNKLVQTYSIIDIEQVVGGFDTLKEVAIWQCIVPEGLRDEETIPFVVCQCLLSNEKAFLKLIIAFVIFMHLVPIALFNPESNLKLLWYLFVNGQLVFNYCFPLCFSDINKHVCILLVLFKTLC
jgi:hypothetical protein